MKNRAPNYSVSPMGLLAVMLLAGVLLLGCDTISGVLTPDAPTVDPGSPGGGGPTVSPLVPQVAGPSVEVKLESASVAAGETVTVFLAVQDDIDISTPQGTGVGSAGIKLTYDGSVLQAVSADSPLTNRFINLKNPGIVLLSAANVGGDRLSGGDAILSIVFQVDSNAPPGDVAVTVERVDLTDTSVPPRTIPTSLTSGVVGVRN